MNFGCGQCMPCRYNRRRLWTHRIVLEALKHERSSFVTLTYDAEHLPPGGTLVPRDVTLWLKRLRKELSPLSLRYFLVGEYGDESWRPHYHAALFGVSPGDSQVVLDSWGKGHVMCGDLNLFSAQYISGYVTKKMTSKTDGRLNGRYPEFTRMSLRPGIGASAIGDIKDSLVSEYGIKSMLENVGVPISLSHGGKAMPLGRYLRRKLSEELGVDGIFKEKDAQIERSWRMQFLYPPLAPGEKAQKILNFESKAKIFEKPKIL